MTRHHTHQGHPMNPGDKVYVTKFALPAGIKTAVVRSVSDDGQWTFVEGDWGAYSSGDVHSTVAEAIEAAEAMRAKKLASLRKQIAKLEDMTFTDLL